MCGHATSKDCQMQGNRRDLERKLAGQLIVDKELPELYLVRLHLVMGAYILSLCVRDPGNTYQIHGARMRPPDPQLDYMRTLHRTSSFNLERVEHKFASLVLLQGKHARPSQNIMRNGTIVDSDSNGRCDAYKLFSGNSINSDPRHFLNRTTLPKSLQSNLSRSSQCN